MPAETPTLDESVSSAVETPAPAAEETPKEEVKAAEPAREVDEETQQALNLLRALKDPTVGKSVARELAVRAGLSVASGEATPAQAKKAVVDVMKESVPQEYHFLVDGLAKGIEAVIASEVEARIQPIQQQSQQALERMVEKEVDTEINDFYRRNKDAKEYKDSIDKLSQKMPWGGPESMSMSEYLDNLYTLVSKESAENKTVSSVVEKINKNAKGAREAPTGAQPTEVKFGSKLPTLNEALKAGARNERLI